MKILCTFSGKFGDILWSLPTVREIANQAVKDLEKLDDVKDRLKGITIDFGIMTAYRSLLPLLNAQNYISKAFVIENWICTGSPCGDQPWEAPINGEGYYLVHLFPDAPPVNNHYDKVYHLTYRHHPSRNQPLIDFTAGQQGIKLPYNGVIPFIIVPKIVVDSEESELLKQELKLQVDLPTIAYAFNESMIDEKLNFLSSLKNSMSSKAVLFKDVSKRSWLEAAYIIANSVAFVGCRSSNYVLACGLGKRVFVHEPNIARSIKGPWGTTFSCPYAQETENDSVEEIRKSVEEIIKEITVL